MERQKERERDHSRSGNPAGSKGVGFMVREWLAFQWILGDA